MGTELTNKVRLVRCPKCHGVLEEPAELKVYMCGGCSTILQAKSRINGVRRESSGLNETVVAAQINGLDHVSGDKESSRSSLNATLLDSGDCSSDLNNERDQSKSSEGNESGSSSPKATSPDSEESFSDLNNEENQNKSSEDKDSSSSGHNETLLDSGECSSDQNNERGQSKSSEGNESGSSSPKATFPDSGECFSDQNNEENQNKSSEDKESDSSSRNATLPDLKECCSDQNSERDQSSEHNESNSSSPKATFPDLGECFSNQNNEKIQNKSSEDKESGSSSRNATLPYLRECSSDQNNERDQSQSSEGHESSSSSPMATFPDSGECFLDQNNEEKQNKSSEDKEYGNSSHKDILPDSGECTSNQTSGRDPYKSSEDCDGKQVGDVKLPNGDQNNHSNRNDSCDFDTEQLEVPNEIFSSTEFAHNEIESLPITGADSEVSLNDESSPLAKSNLEGDMSKEVDSDFRSSSAVDSVATRENSSIIADHMPPRESISSDTLISSPDEQSNIEVDINKETDSGFRSSSSVNPVATTTRGSSSIVTAHMPARESISSDSLLCSPDEQLELPQNSVLNGFSHVMSPDTFEETTQFDPSSDRSRTLRDMSKSPTTRSHHAYYDGSVSSYDGTDDQFSNRNIHSFKDTYRVANFVHSEERPRRDKFLVQNMMDRDSGLQNQVRNSWSRLSNKNDHALKCRKWDHDELLQPRRQGQPRRDWTRLQSGEYVSRMSFPRRGSHIGYENGGHTNQLHNEFQRNSGYQSANKSVEAEQDKMTLLKMVYELQNQVNNLNEKAGGRVSGGATWKEKHIPRYHNYEASEEELFQGLNHPRHLRRRRDGGHYPQNQKFMRIPFSSEATTSRHQVDPSCLHCYPQDWQCSAPLPPPIRYNSNGLCRVHLGHSCWTSHDNSCPSSPKRYVESDFPLWGRETMSDDQRHRSHEVKKYFREKHHLAKRHFRPMAGGAPLITCYNCLKLLQIPADFLLFKRRCHKLRCGACSEVLKFSLQKRCHIIPYELITIDPPPSEVEDSSDAINGSNLASASQPFECQHADPVSCSDDYGYGLSYCQSCSTEGDPGNFAPHNSLQGNSDDRNMSYSSLDPMRERKELVLNQSRNKDKGPMERYVSARPSWNVLKSEKLSSEIEELPPKSSSPLHRLMGYSSPSQVIRGSALSRSGTATSSYLMQREP